MSTSNICFYGELTKIILQLSLNVLLICSTAAMRPRGCLFSLRYKFVPYLRHIMKKSTTKKNNMQCMQMASAFSEDLPLPHLTTSLQVA